MGRRKLLILFLIMGTLSFIFGKNYKLEKPILLRNESQYQKEEVLFKSETLNYDVGVVKIISPDNLIPFSQVIPIVKIKNFGREPSENFLVKLTISAFNYFDVKQISYLSPFSETILYFNSFIPTESISFFMKCTVDFSLDENESNNLLNKKGFIYNYFENFESEAHDFRPLPEGGFNRLQWGLNNTFSFVSADGVGGDYHNMAKFRLISPPLFALVDSPIIAYWHKYNIEFYYDGYNVKCSLDNSPWRILHAIPDLGQSYSTVASIYTLGIPGESCYSGFSNWRLNYLKIPVLKNQKFYLSFDFGSDNADNEEGGVFLDNLYGIGFSNLAPYFYLEIKELGSPKEPVFRNELISPQIKIKNYCHHTCENIILHLRITPGDYFSERIVERLLPNQEAIISFDYWEACSTFNLLECSLYYYPEKFIKNFKKEIFVCDYYEDFQRGDGMFIPEPNYSWYYSRYFGLPNDPGGWGMFYYENNASWKLRSPTFYALVDTPIIAYWHKYENEYRFDGYNVKCSIFGTYWQILHAYPGLGQSYDTIARGGNMGISLESCYTGYYSWRLNYLKIPVRRGQFFKINFHFGSDYSDIYEGPMIDKIYGIGMIKRTIYDVGIKEVIKPETLIKAEIFRPLVKIKNYGERAAENFKVYFYIDPGDYYDSIFVSQLLPEEETLLIFSSFQPIANHTYYFAECEISFPADENPENDEIEYEFYTYQYFEDFERSEGGYLPLPESGWKYLNINNNWVFSTGVYENNANWKLVSPIFIVTGTPAFLIYSHKYSTEFEKDGYNVKCSSAYSPRWQVIHPYNINYDGLASPNNVGIPNEECFTGLRDWQQVVFDIPLEIGAQFKLLFHFGSDGVNIDSGVIIDNIYGIGFDTISLGIEERKHQEIISLPLIVKKQILIDLPKEEKIEIKIFDITGKLLYHKKFFDKRIMIKKFLPKGVYFVKIKSNSLNMERKVIF